jgi:hypothetical protein
MKPRPTLLALLLPTAAIAAPAAPTYLECKGDYPAFQLTMDEANGTVTYYMPATGHTEKLQAAFGPTEVSARSRSMAITVNRVDLSVSRIFAVLPKPDHGTCRVMQAPKRAF